MIGELVKIAGQCDGVRCDMAMLVLPDVFERTWGIGAEPFWPKATQRVRERVPGFCFMAEVYWDLEWTLQQQGFDYTYDKRLYDRLRERHARPVREHFHAGTGLPGQAGPLPGEPRRAAGRGDVSAGNPRGRGRHHFPVAGAAVLPPGTVRGAEETHLAPSRSRARTSPSIRRSDSSTTGSCRPAPPVVRDGQWQLLECVPAWDGNWTYDCFVAFAWQGPDGERLLVAVNYAPNQSQCRVRLPFAIWAERRGGCRTSSAPTATSGMATNCNRRDYSSIYDPGKHQSLH